jgi:Zn-dependent peptidase ImmA (M78 family)
LNKDTVLAQLSVLHRYDDIFWFSLFHELAHALLHGKKEVFVETADNQKTAKNQEADQFAADTLIPPAQVDRLRRLRPRSEAQIRALAEKMGVAPSIVVGRLQHEGLLAHTHLNRLRSKFEIMGC